VVGLWREDLRKVNPKAAEALADPSQYANLFPNMAEALQAESLQVRARQLCCCMRHMTCVFIMYAALTVSCGSGRVGAFL
jgi:hypothetical protein